MSIPWPAFRAAGTGETDVQPPSAICHIRSEMFIGTSSLVIECIGNSLTHRDYEPGYPHVRVAGYTATCQRHSQSERVNERVALLSTTQICLLQKANVHL